MCPTGVATPPRTGIHSPGSQSLLPTWCWAQLPRGDWQSRPCPCWGLPWTPPAPGPRGQRVPLCSLSSLCPALTGQGPSPHFVRVPDSNVTTSRARRASAGVRDAEQDACGVGQSAGCTAVSRAMQEGCHALPGHSTGLQAQLNAVFEEEQAHPSVLFTPQRSLCADIPFLKTVWIHGKYPDCFAKDKQARVTLVVQMPLKLKQKCLDVPHE